MIARDRLLMSLAYRAWDLSAWALRQLPADARAMAVTRMQIATLRTCPHRAGSTANR